MNKSRTNRRQNIYASRSAIYRQNVLFSDTTSTASSSYAVAVNNNQLTTDLSTTASRRVKHSTATFEFPQINTHPFSTVGTFINNGGAVYVQISTWDPVSSTYVPITRPFTLDVVKGTRVTVRYPRGLARWYPSTSSIGAYQVSFYANVTSGIVSGANFVFKVRASMLLAEDVLIP